MIRVVLFLGVVFALAFGFSMLADRPGEMTINWLGYEFQTSMMVAMVALVALVAAIMITWWLISGVLNSPQMIARWRKGRRRDRGYDALSRGLIAAGSGDAGNARKFAKDSAKFLQEEPLVALLDAQTALLEGNRDVARSRFETMLENPDTKLLGLRGLFVEAERQGELAVAGHFAEKAFEIDPATSWAGQALLRNQSLTRNWEGSLLTLESVRAAGGVSKEEANRKKAVLLTARAMEEEDANPDGARSWALAAHKLEPSLVPAAVTAATLCSRTGDLRKAAKVLEATWKLEPHPEIAEAYVHLRAGDATHDRLKRAKTLASRRPNHVEGQIAIAHAAIDASEWKQARDAMESVLRNSPSERACLLMADIEEAEFGDQGRVRDWLARAVRAPRDAAWTEDGQTSDHWAAVSPVTGKLDAFEWRVPVEQLGAPEAPTDYSEFVNLAPPPKPEPVAETEPAILSSGATGVATMSDDETSPPRQSDIAEVEDAEVIEETISTETAGSNIIELEVSNRESETGIMDDSQTPDAAPEPRPTEIDATSSPRNADDAEATADAESVADEDKAVARLMEHQPDDPGIPEENQDGEKKRFGLF